MAHILIRCFPDCRDVLERTDLSGGKFGTEAEIIVANALTSFADGPQLVPGKTVTSQWSWQPAHEGSGIHVGILVRATDALALDRIELIDMMKLKFRQLFIDRGVRDEETPNIPVDMPVIIRMGSRFS